MKYLKYIWRKKFTQTELERHFQSEYDARWIRYNRGSTMCVIEMKAIVELAHRIGLDIQEHEFKRKY